MDDGKELVCIFANGRIFNGPTGVTFESNRVKVVKVDPNITLGSLKQVIGQKLQLPLNQLVANLVYRYPTCINPLQYQACNLEDDSDIKQMWQVIKRFSAQLTCVELYANICDIEYDDHVESQPVESHPAGDSILYLQPQHISQEVWNNNVCRILHTRRIMHTNRMIEPPNQIIEYLISAGFYGVARVGQFDYDRSLVSAFVERWRPETHTFHTTRGECTITLEDVAIQLGLPCSGMAVIGRTDFNWLDICEQLLGIRPPANKIHGQRLLLSWLEEQFNHLPDDADDVQIQQFTRAYILRLIGGYLMPDRSGNRVYLMYLPLLDNFQEVGKFSWGSAVLAHLYRELCNATNPTEDGIGGCLSLLHLWVWDRFPILAPRQPVSPDPHSDIYPLLPPLGFRWKNVGQHSRPIAMPLIQYRSFLDKMTDNEIIWRPYESPEVGLLIPEYCLLTPEIWLASVPLICFNIIEWHHPDRVLRQFSRQQPIPATPVHLGEYHTMQLRGRIDTDWIHQYSNFIQAWDAWPHAIANAPLAIDEFDRISEYMQWYWRNTRRWIQRTSGDTGYAADIAEELCRLTINSRSVCSNCIDYRDRVARDQHNILLALREQRFNMNPEPAPPTIELPRPQIPLRKRPSKRRGGYLSTQPPIENKNTREQNSQISNQAHDKSASSSSPVTSPNSSQLEPHHIAPSSSAPSNSANANASIFDQGGPSNETLSTPRQSICLNESPGLDLNISNKQINVTSESQEVNTQQPKRMKRTRFGTKSRNK